MPTFNLPTETGYNFSSGLDQVFVYVAGEIPYFIPMLLLIVFLMIWITGYITEKRREGYSSNAIWCAVAGWSTFFLAEIMSLIRGLIVIPTVIIFLVIAIIGSTWAWFSD